jgi:hypothetical protein
MRFQHGELPRPFLLGGDLRCELSHLWTCSYEPVQKGCVAKCELLQSDVLALIGCY